MKVPKIPARLFKYGIRPGVAEIEPLFNSSTGKGVHLCGFDVETVGTKLFKSNDLYSIQLVMDSPENSHIFLDKEPGIGNLDLFFSIIPKGGDNYTRVFATAHNASFDIGALLGNDVYELMKGYPIGGWTGKIVEGNSCFAILFNKEKRQRLTIADSLSWYKASLKKIAEKYFGEDSQKLDRPDYLGKRCPESMDEAKIFFDYAEKDALIQLKLTKNIYNLCIERRSEERRVGKVCRSRWSP